MFKRLLAKMWLHFHFYCTKCGEYDGMRIKCECTRARKRLKEEREEATRLRMKAIVAGPRGGE